MKGHCLLLPLLVSGWTLGLVSLLAANDPVPSKPPPVGNLREAMSAEEFSATGLEKLTPEELEALRGWVNRYVSQEKTKAVEVAVQERKEVIKKETERAFGFLNVWGDGEPVPEELKGPDYIESTVPGKFRGWNGGSRFVLANGQVWEQLGNDQYFMPLTDPAVRIEKGSLGSHYLRVLETGRRVKVRRVK